MGSDAASTTTGLAAGARAGMEAGADGHLISDSEVWDIADAIPDGSTAAMALIEHVWAGPLREAIDRAGGVPVSDEWVGRDPPAR